MPEPPSDDRENPRLSVLGQALRDNLRKRRAQAQARAAVQEAGGKAHDGAGDSSVSDNKGDPA